MQRLRIWHLVYQSIVLFISLMESDMTTTTFSHNTAEHASSQSLHGVVEFPVSWFQATPAYLVLRPVAAFVKEWAQATPACIALRALLH